MTCDWPPRKSFLSIMTIGQKHTEQILVTTKMVADFAQVSGDFNPIHLDPEYARQTPFKKPIAHGLLSAALLSGIVGTRFPGPGTVLLKQGLSYKKPVFVGDKIEFRLVVTSVRADKPIVTLSCEVLNSSGEVTADGEVVIKLPA